MRNYELTHQNKLTISLTPPNVYIERPDEMLWLTQEEIATLFDTAKDKVRSIIVKLIDQAMIDKPNHTRRIHFTKDVNGVPQASFDTQYTIQVITLIAFSIETPQALAFQQWSVKISSQYMTKGFCINKPYLKESKKSAENLKRQVKQVI